MLICRIAHDHTGRDLSGIKVIQGLVEHLMEGQGVHLSWYMLLSL